VTALGSCMSALDGSVVNVALPVIQSSTGATVSAVGWVVLIYLITVSASVLLFGRLGDIYGKRRIYLWGLTIFMLGSLFCGLSRTIGLLILSRGIQGIGSAMVYALGPAIVVTTFPPSERGRALGIQATTTYLGLFIGPGLGGLLTQHFGWASIFFINLPIGLLMLAIAIRYLHPTPPDEKQPLDLAGSLLMGAALVSLLLVLTQGGEWGWMSPGVWSFAALFAGATALFIRVELRSDYPALDLHLFQNRLFTFSVLAAFGCYCCWASVGFLMPFFLLHGIGMTPAIAGGIMMAVPLTMMATAGLGGWLADHVDVRVPTTLGLTLMALGIALLSQVNLGDSPWQMAARLAVIGVGVGLFGAANNSALMGSVPFNRQGVAGAVMAGARSIGFAVGIAVASLIYETLVGSTAASGSPEQIETAVQIGFRITVGMALTGAVVSLFRGGKGRLKAEGCQTIGKKET